MLTITSFELEEIDDKVKGLADLLWAMSAQIEIGTYLRVEGARMLAYIANDIENMLNSVLKENGITVKDGDAARTN